MVTDNTMSKEEVAKNLEIPKYLLPCWLQKDKKKQEMQTTK